MNGAPDSKFDPTRLRALPDNELQDILLEGVSRTFALTIPQLPEGLYAPVANAYLLCRIVDTIEDEISLTPEQKKSYCSEFIDVVKTSNNTNSFAERLAPLLSEQTIPAEHSLIRLIPRVIAITHTFAAPQIEALANCVETMAKGMPIYQAHDLHAGLATMPEMNDYCYYVAGCVGEMLAKLFCHYSPEISRHRKQLLELSVSFGQGLQMTNILKDIWDDAERGVCWLPQEIFNETGFDLSNIQYKKTTLEFQQGLEHLINIAHDHLKDALAYTLLIPEHETGIRNFCFWALGMAVLTLKKIKNNLGFTDSQQVKISRNSVKATILATRICVKNNTLLTMLFNFMSRGVITPGWQYSPQPSKP